MKTRANICRLLSTFFHILLLYCFRLQMRRKEKNMVTSYAINDDILQIFFFLQIYCKKMQAIYKYLVPRLVRHINIREFCFRRTSVTHRILIPKNCVYVLNSKNITTNNILELLNNLKKNGTLGNELHNEMEKCMKQYYGSTFGNDRMIIEACYNDLVPLADLKTSLHNLNDDNKIKYLSDDVLHTMKHHNHSIIELLIKLKLIYSHLLKDNSFDKNLEYSLDDQETFEEQFKSPEAEQNDFLNELMNAPLDDIGLFLEERGQNFNEYYRMDIIEDLVYRISHSTENTSTNSEDIIDNLCDYIKNSLTKRYAPLTSIQIITYIEDQYHAEETLKYRLLLKKFITDKPKKFTFADFYTTTLIGPVFPPKLEMQFNGLFNVYCSKVSKHIQHNICADQSDKSKFSRRNLIFIDMERLQSIIVRKYSQLHRWNRYRRPVVLVWVSHRLVCRSTGHLPLDRFGPICLF